MVAAVRVNAPCQDDVQSAFLSALPRISLHARIYFRHVRCRHRKADLVSETISFCWKWWLRLVERGKDPAEFVSTLASFAACAVRAGRRVCGQEAAKDVLSSRAQLRHSFTVSTIPSITTMVGNELTEALQDNTRSSVPDQVHFRCEFPSWLVTHSHRNRSLVLEMAKGERTSTLAGKFGMSQGRISQLRQEFQEDWLRFTDDVVC